MNRTTPPTRGRPVAECAVGETVCRVRVWDRARWESTPPELRPERAEYFPGLGWVVALLPGRDRYSLAGPELPTIAEGDRGGTPW